MALRRRAPLLVGAVTALCLSAVACTPTDQPTPSPTPPTSASPTETELERQTRLDFEAAEKAYRTFSAEVDRLANAGGAVQPTKLLEDNGAGPQLKSTSTYLKQLHDLGAKASGRIEIAYVRPGAYASDRLTLETCEDGSGFEVHDKNGKVLAQSDTAKVSVDVRMVAGRWRVWESKPTKVATCV